MTHLDRLLLASATLACFFSGCDQGQNTNPKLSEAQSTVDANMSPKLSEDSRQSTVDSNGQADDQSWAGRRDAALRVFQDGAAEGATAGVRLYEELLSDTREKYPVTEYPNRHEEIVRSLIDLAASYSLTGRSSEAILLGIEAHQICEKLYREDQWPTGLALTAECSVNIAGFYNADGKATQGETWLDRTDKLLKAAPFEPDFYIAFVQMAAVG